jgi:hypothetical protein
MDFQKGMLAFGYVCRSEDDEIPNGAVTRHKAWVLYDTPEWKIELMPLKHPGSPVTRNLETTIFLGRLWKLSLGLSRCSFNSMECGFTVNAELYLKLRD